jgi:hypothetical protein
VCFFDIKSSSLSNLILLPEETLASSSHTPRQNYQVSITQLYQKCSRPLFIDTTLRVHPRNFRALHLLAPTTNGHPRNIEEQLYQKSVPSLSESPISTDLNPHKHHIFDSLATTQLKPATMPGRKSNLSTVTNGDEESPAPTGRQVREGSSVEVLSRRIWSSKRKVANTGITGSISAANHDFEVSKGRSTAQHIDPQGCFVGFE